MCDNGLALTVPACFTKKLANAKPKSQLAERIPAAKSEEECVKKCFHEQPECAAVNYDKSDGGCHHMHRDSGAASDLEWSDCCDRYTIDCGSST